MKKKEKTVCQIIRFRGKIEAFFVSIDEFATSNFYPISGSKSTSALQCPANRIQRNLQGSQVKRQFRHIFSSSNIHPFRSVISPASDISSAQFRVTTIRCVSIIHGSCKFVCWDQSCNLVATLIRAAAIFAPHPSHVPGAGDGGPHTGGGP